MVISGIADCWPWNDLNTTPDGLLPGAARVTVGAELGCLRLGTTYARQFGLGLEKNTTRGSNLHSTPEDYQVCLLTFLFCGILLYPSLHSHCQACAGALGPFRCSSHPQLWALQKCHSCPPTPPTAGSSEECTSQRNTQTIARPRQEGSYCTGLWQTSKKPTKTKNQIELKSLNCYQHLPSRLSVLKAKIPCKDEGNIPLVISQILPAW